MNRRKIFIAGIVVFLLLAMLAVAISALVLARIWWPLIIALLVVSLFEVCFGFRIIVSGRSSFAKACWIIIIILLPIIGILTFLIFGVNPLKKRQRNKYFKHQAEYLEKEDFKFSQEFLSQDNNQYKWLYQYGVNNLRKPVSKNNHIKIIEDNTKLFEESINLIRSAKQYINVQSYIFSYSGFWTKIFFSELIKKANEGVKVRVLYDWLGSNKRVENNIYKELEKYGVEIACFNPKGLTMFKGATNYRLHSKFVIVDNKTALYGGSNFSDEYLSMSRDNCHWKDLNFLISGPIVNSMNTTFINYWLRFTENTTSKWSKQNLRNDINLILEKNKFDESDTIAQLLVFEPDFNEFALENVFIHSFYNAKKSIKIITPYFAPPKKIIDALIFCHKQGIKVELIAHNKNQKYVQMLNRENYEKLAKEGIEVREYDGYLHAKGIIIDDEYVLTGSCNIDYRSIYLDFESEMIVLDKEFVNGMNKVFENIKKNTEIQTPSLLAKKLTPWSRFLIILMNFGKSVF